MTENWYRISHVTLNETLTGRFLDTSDQHPRATIDVVRQGKLSTALPGPSAAEQRKYRNMANYYELVSGCRVGDFNLGWLNRALSIPYTVSGTWSTTGRSGQCTQSQTLSPELRARSCDRRGAGSSTRPLPRQPSSCRSPHRGRIDCRYQYPNDLGTGYATSGLGSYIQPADDTARIIVPTATMANRTIVTIPFRFQKSIKHSWWWNGNVDWEASATGSLTLTRYKHCRLTPQSPIGAYCAP